MAEPAYPLALLENDGQTWPAQGEWTYEDYLRLPEGGQRYEVLRGVLHVTPVPAYGHQFSIWRLSVELSRPILEQDLGVLLMAPFDIRLPNRLADPVEPDLVFFRKGNEPQADDKDFTGVPDLVIEVLSPGTRKVDERIKMPIYREAAGMGDRELREALSGQLCRCTGYAGILASIRAAAGIEDEGTAP